MTQPNTAVERSKNQEAILFFGFLVAALLGTAIWLAYSRFHLTPRQLACFSLVPLFGALFAWDALRYFATLSHKRETMWPKPRRYFSLQQDAQQVAEAQAGAKVLLGHDTTTGQPFYWTNEQRTMQGICYGASGAGKTTLLESIAQQDIARGGPLILIDGKGDRELFDRLVPAIAAAGRLQQLRLIDPNHPESSVAYNPFWNPHGTPDDHVGFIFESFRDSVRNTNAFFDGHQRVYLENIARVLFYSRKRFNFYDVLVAAYDEGILRRQMKIALDRVVADPSVSEQQRLTLTMSIRNLLATFEDQERVTKIQGLINHMMTFMADDLALITGPYDDLLTLDDVVDNNLILYMSLNVNVNTRAVTSLGRILLQNFQLMIGRRYAKSTLATRHPFLSVIMDEFSPFAYENFSTIIQTARGANVAFLFALQSAPQLLQVGQGFRRELSSAPNTKFMLRISDEETAKEFLNASAHVKKVRRSVKFRKTGLFRPQFEEEDTGSQAEVLDTTAQDEHLKKMPTGQMELLMSDPTQGLILQHLQIRPPIRHFPAELPPPLYPALAVKREESEGLHLRFPVPELEERREELMRRKSWRGGKR